MIAIERLLLYALRGHGGLMAASLQVRERGDGRASEPLEPGWL
jgi:hypothetical protein